MKNLITSIACVTILLVFVLQFATNQVTYNHLSSVDKEVNCFKEICKQEGCVSETNSNTLIQRLVYILGCDNSKINVSGTHDKQARGERIHYVIKVPLENLIAASKFWGLTKEQNNGIYIIDNYTTSEYLNRSAA